jgi:hypothetical protein
VKRKTFSLLLWFSLLPNLREALNEILRHPEVGRYQLLGVGGQPVCKEDSLILAVTEDDQDVAFLAANVLDIMAVSQGNITHIARAEFFRPGPTA